MNYENDYDTTTALTVEGCDQCVSDTFGNFTICTACKNATNDLAEPLNDVQDEIEYEQICRARMRKKLPRKLNHHVDGQSLVVSNKYSIYIHVNKSGKSGFVCPSDLCKVLSVKRNSKDLWANIVTLYINLIERMYQHQILSRDFTPFMRKDWIKRCIQQRVIYNKNYRQQRYSRQETEQLLAGLKHFKLLSHVLASDFYSIWFKGVVKPQMFSAMGMADAIFNKEKIINTINEVVDDFKEDPEFKDSMADIAIGVVSSIGNKIKTSITNTCSNVYEALCEVFDKVYSWFLEQYNVVTRDFRFWTAHVRVSFLYVTTKMAESLFETFSVYWICEAITHWLIANFHFNAGGQPAEYTDSWESWDYSAYEEDEVTPHGKPSMLIDFFFKILNYLSPNKIGRTESELILSTMNLVESSSGTFMKWYNMAMYAITRDRYFKFGSRGAKVLHYDELYRKIVQLPKLSHYLQTDQAYRDTVDKLIQNMSEDRVKWAKDRSSIGLIRVLERHIDQLTRLLAQNKLVTEEVKPDGLVIAFDGSAGQGKSAIAEVVRLLCERLVGTKAYIKVPGTDFNDGAQEKKVWTYPELNQSSDPSVRAADMIEILRNCSTDLVTLNMAGIEEKGIHVCKMEYCISTSNANIDSGAFGIIQMDAFKRRGLHITVHKEEEMRFHDMEWDTFLEKSKTAWILSVRTGPKYEYGRTLLAKYLFGCTEEELLVKYPCCMITGGRIGISLFDLCHLLVKYHVDPERLSATPAQVLATKVHQLDDIFPSLPVHEPPKLDVESKEKKWDAKTLMEEAGQFIRRSLDDSVKPQCLDSAKCDCEAGSTSRRVQLAFHYMPYFSSDPTLSAYHAIRKAIKRIFLELGVNAHDIKDLFNLSLEGARGLTISQLIAASIRHQGLIPQYGIFVEYIHQIYRILSYKGQFVPEPAEFTDPMYFGVMNAAKVIKDPEAVDTPAQVKLFSLMKMPVNLLDDTIPVKCNWKGIFATGFIVVGIMALVTGIFTYFKSQMNVTAQSEASFTDKGDPDRPPPTKKTNIGKAARAHYRTVKPKGNHDDIPVSMLAAVRGNMRKFTAIGSSSTYKVNALFIGGRTLMVVKHALKLPGFTMIKLEPWHLRDNNRSPLHISRDDFDIVEGEGDMAYIVFKRGTSNINDSTALGKYAATNINASTSVYRLNPDDLMLESVGKPSKASSNLKVGKTGYVENNYYSIYGLSTKDGDCGMPYFAKIDGQWKIAFIHAGEFHNGSSAVIPFKLVDEVKPHGAQGLHITKDVEALLTRKWKTPFDISNSVALCGSTVFYSGKGGNEYKPHPFMPYYDPEVIKDVKRPINRKQARAFAKWYIKRRMAIDPMSIELKSTIKNNPSLLWQGFVEEFKIWEGGIQVREIKEALFGCDYWNGLSRKTSIGLWKHLCGDPDLKQHIYETQIIPDNLIQAVNERLELLKQGKCWWMVTGLCLKAELLPYSKEYPRVFMPINFPDLLVFKMVLGDMMQLLGVNSSTKNYCRYNPHGMQVQRLYQMLTKFDKHGEGDVSSLDNNQKPSMAHVFGLFMANISGTKGEVWIMIYTLCANVTVYIFVHNGMFYMSYIGLPSGSYITALFNAFTQYVVIKWTCTCVYPGVDLHFIVSFVGMGDDTAYSFNSKFPDVNMIVIAFIAKQEFGYTVTDGNKQEITEPYIEGLPSFLSRTFNFVDGVVAHALNPDSIYGFLRWSHKETPDDEIIRQTSNMALMEAVYHGRTFFEAVRNELVNAATKYGCNADFKDWYYYKNRWFQRYVPGAYNNSIDTSEDWMVHYFTLDSSPDSFGHFEGQVKPHSMECVLASRDTCLSSCQDPAFHLTLKDTILKAGAPKGTADANTEIGTLNLADNQEVKEDIQQLTTLNKTESVTAHECEGLSLLAPMHHVMSTKDTPLEILSRKYLVFEQALGTGGAETIVGGFESIYSRPLVKTIIDRFRYFRADSIEFDISVTAPISLAGFITAFWYPMYPRTSAGNSTFPNQKNWTDFMTNDIVILAASESESGILNCKWQAPWKYAVANRNTDPSPTTQYPDTEGYLKGLGRLVLDAHQFVQVDEASPNVTIRVFARYVNPVLQAPYAVVPTGGFVRPHASTTTQGMDNAVRASRSIYDNIGMVVNSNNIKTALATWAIGNKYFKDAQKLFGESMTMMGSLENGSIEDEESPGTAKTGGSHQSVRQSVWGETASCNLEPGILNLGDNSNIVPIRSTDTGADTEIGIYELCKRWHYVADGQYNPANGGALYIETGLRDTAISRGYLQFFSRFFRFWRGSLRYKVIFFGTPLVTYNMVIVLTPGPNGWNRTEKDVIGDNMTQHVTVRGTTVVEVVVPFVRQTAWEYRNSTDTWAISIDGWTIGSTSGANEVSLPYLVVKCAGDDFRFRSLCSPATPAIDDTLTVKPQGLLDHSDVLIDYGVNIQPLYEYQAFHGSLRDLITRYSSRKESEFTARFGQNIVEADGGTEIREQYYKADIMDWIATLFVGYSGSYRTKIPIRSTTSPTDETDLAVYMAQPAESINIVGVSRLTYQPRYGDGAYRTNTDIWPIVEAEVPFLSVFPWVPVSPLYSKVSTGPSDVDVQYVEDPVQPIYSFGVETSPALDGDYMVAAGADFSFHILLPAPESNILPTNKPFSRGVTIPVPPMVSSSKGKSVDNGYPVIKI